MTKPISQQSALRDEKAFRREQREIKLTRALAYFKANPSVGLLPTARRFHVSWELLTERIKRGGQ